MADVMITGCDGYLGRELCRAFDAKGDTVIGIDVKHGAFTDILCDLDGDEWKNQEFPECDILICNAKIESWDSHFHLASLARDCVVNIASIYGQIASDPQMYLGTEIDPTPAWYVAVKGAMVALTRHQAVTLAPVRVNAVCPGGIFRDHSPEFVHNYTAKVPLKRMATEMDIVEPVMFLASDAARYITGHILMVDGGLSAW